MSHSLSFGFPRGLNLNVYFFNLHLRRGKHNGIFFCHSCVLQQVTMAEKWRNYMRSYRHLTSEVNSYVQQSSQSSTNESQDVICSDLNSEDDFSASTSSQDQAEAEYESPEESGSEKVENCEIWFDAASHMEIDCDIFEDGEDWSDTDSFVEEWDDYYDYFSGDDSSSDSDFDAAASNEASGVPDLQAELAAWATEHKLTRPALNDLLSVLIKQGNRLPRDARTLLKTPRTVECEEKCGGCYTYFGMESGIVKILASQNFNETKIKLQVNVDGIPLSKSGKKQMWPILCAFEQYEPFIVAVYSGDIKPTCPEEFLFDFLNEYNHLKTNGIRLDDTNYQVQIQAFVCDAPAREFLKRIIGHTGYFSCERCVIKGQWHGRVVFNNASECPHRTEDHFNNQEYSHHQKAKSPLIDAGISCISLFVLDYMHLVCLGVVRRLLRYITIGPRYCRLSRVQIEILSDRLIGLNGEMPSEFARQPRSLSDLDRWKATEFRQFLLYTGPVVLRGILNNQMYTHFLILSTAMSILLDECDRRRTAYLPYAKQLLDFFVKKAPFVYGKTFCTYNVHALKHLHEDAEYFGVSLNDINAFKFENFLQKIKKLVRGPNNPISQISKRLKEFDNSHRFTQQHYKKRRCILSNKTKDANIFLKNEDFAVIVEHTETGYVCDVIKQRYMSEFYTKPCPSKLFNIAYVSDTVLRKRAERRTIPKEQILRKAVRVRHSEGYVFFPLLHNAEK